MEHDWYSPPSGIPTYCRSCGLRRGVWPKASCPPEPIYRQTGGPPAYIVTDLDGEFIAGAGGSAGLVTLTPEDLDRGAASYGPAGGGGSGRPLWRRRLRRAARRLTRLIP